MSTQPEHMPFAGREDLPPIFTSREAQAWYEAGVILRDILQPRITRMMQKHPSAKRLRKINVDRNVLDRVVPALFQKATSIERNARKR